MHTFVGLHDTVGSVRARRRDNIVLAYYKPTVQYSLSYIYYHYQEVALKWGARGVFSQSKRA
jgi:hypothetical protein